MKRLELEVIMTRARVAQRRWVGATMRERLQTLTALRRTIARERDLIVDTIAAETGKPRLDALSGDVLVTLEQMMFYEREAARLLKPRKLKKSRVLFPGCEFYEELEPHGVALIYGPSNYPFQLAMVPAITALFAGNAVVLKVSERTPGVSRLIAKLAEENLPADLLQVFDDEPSIAASLIEAGPDFVFFTGSSANGREVAARAAVRCIPHVLELGGKDAAIVFADCKLERAVEGIVYGAFAMAGQVCVGIKRLYVEQPLYERFVALVCERARELRVGSGPDCDLPLLREERLRDQLRSQVSDALAHGAQARTGDANGDGPIVLTNVAAQARILMEESFAPVLCVAPFATEAEAVVFANDSPFALGASVWTEDLERGRRVASTLRAGNCAVNDVIRNIANPAAAFGGNGASGYGRYHGAQGLVSFSRVKTVMVRRTNRERERHWFPLTEESRAGLSRVIELRHRPLGWLRALRRMMAGLGIVALCATTSHAWNAGEGSLRLDIRVPAHDHGRVAWAVFHSADGFPGDPAKAVRHGFSADSGGQAHVEIEVGSLPAGRYAVAAYLDENGNDKLDYRLFKIPREPVGASNNPAGRLGPPRFSDCVFDLGPRQETVEIELVDPK